MDKLWDMLPDEVKKRVRVYDDNRSFRFSNDSVYPSKEEVSIPITLGKLKENVKVSLIDANVPLLLGRPDMERLGFVVDFKKRTLKIKDTGETFSLKRTVQGHLALPIISPSPSEE